MSYFAPDTLGWESLDVGYTEFVSWVLNGDLQQFYGEHRWEGWQRETETVCGDSAFSVYPFLVAEGPPMAERSRKVVPMAELVGLHFTIRAGLLQESRSGNKT